MGILIRDITREEYDGCNPDAPTGKPFPFNHREWVNHTAEIMDISIKIDNNSGYGNDQLVIQGRNGEYACQVYLSLDPTITSPNCKDVNKQIKTNQTRLLKAVKGLGIGVFTSRGLEVEERLLKKAIGKYFSFGIIGQTENGAPKVNAKGYKQFKTIFGGTTLALLPVPPPIQTPAAEQATDEGKTDWGSNEYLDSFNF
jgi:hypothetical protein